VSVCRTLDRSIPSNFLKQTLDQQEQRERERERDKEECFCIVAVQRSDSMWVGLCGFSVILFGKTGLKWIPEESQDRERERERERGSKGGREEGVSA
jgi:hypothetical protein